MLLFKQLCVLRSFPLHRIESAFKTLVYAALSLQIRVVNHIINKLKCIEDDIVLPQIQQFHFLDAVLRVQMLLVDLFEVSNLLLIYLFGDLLHSLGYSYVTFLSVFLLEIFNQLIKRLGMVQISDLAQGCLGFRDESHIPVSIVYKVWIESLILANFLRR